MKQNIIWSIIVVIVFIVGFKLGQPSDLQKANYNTLPFKIELINSYEEYYSNVETLLDSIATQDNNFIDVVMESDEYSDYYQSKLTVDSLISLIM